jgi:hypothetical protein
LKSGPSSAIADCARSMIATATEQARAEGIQDIGFPQGRPWQRACRLSIGGRRGSVGRDARARSIASHSIDHMLSICYHM